MDIISKINDFFRGRSREAGYLSLSFQSDRLSVFLYPLNRLSSNQTEIASPLESPPLTLPRSSPRHGRGIRKDSYGFTLVDFSNLIHSGNKLEDEPFILASQANQVFYVQDLTRPGWCTVMGVKARDSYDMGNEDMLEGIEHEPYHIATVLGDQSWVRSEIEGTVVQAEETYRPLRRTTSF